MSIFAIGDLHLSLDERVDKPMDVFGPEWKNHWLHLEDYWKKNVKPTDTVLIAGDISWGLKLEEAMEDLKWIDSMPGHKVMIKGNHDLWWTGIKRLNQLFDSITFLQNTCYPLEDYVICGTRGWICPGSEGFKEEDIKIYKREVLRLKASLEEGKKAKGKEIIAMIHYPPTNDKMQGSEFTKAFEEAGVKTVLYGHLHGKEAYKKGIKGNFNGVIYQLISLDYLGCQLKKVRG